MEGTSKKIFNGITIAGGIIGIALVIFGQIVLPHFKKDCDPNYSPCVTYVNYDLDCPEIGHQVSVEGVDRYRLDGDRDGVGCETYGNGDIFWSLIVSGAVGAFIGGWVGLFASMAYESRENKVKARRHNVSSNENLDSLVEKAIVVIRKEGIASTAIFQKELHIGYGLASRVMERLESMGYVGQAKGAKPRSINLPPK